MGGSQLTMTPLSDLSAADLLLSGWHHDFTVTYGDKVYRLHRSILAASSKFFRGFFNTTPDVDSIDFTVYHCTDDERCSPRKQPTNGDHHAVASWVLDYLIQAWYTGVNKPIVLAGSAVFDRKTVQTEISTTCKYLSCREPTVVCDQILDGKIPFTVERWYDYLRFECPKYPQLNARICPFDDAKVIIKTMKEYLGLVTDNRCHDIYLTYTRKVEAEHKGDVTPQHHFMVLNGVDIELGFGQPVDLIPYLETFVHQSLDRDYIV